MDDAQLPALFDPLLDFLAAKLPPPIYGAVDLLITQSYALISSLVELVGALLGNSPATWDMQTILPPIITLLAAYLALVSFYRTTGWMIRMAFAFVKWGFILTTLGGAAGYFFANANPGGNGLAMFGDGLLPTLGGMFLDMFNEGKQQGSTKTKGKGRGSTRGKASTKKSRPKAWESWDKHKEWQYSEKTHTESANVQEVIANILGTAGKAVKESGWWETAKGAYEKATQAQEQRAKGKSRSR